MNDPILKDALLEHIEEEGSIRFYDCPWCDEVFGEVEEFEEHAESHHWVEMHEEADEREAEK